MTGAVGRLRGRAVAGPSAQEQLEEQPPVRRPGWSPDRCGAPPGPVFEQAQDACNNSGAVPYNLRSIDEITAFFDGLELVEPGVVPVTQWRPEHGSGVPEVIAEHGGLARKP